MSREHFVIPPPVELQFDTTSAPGHAFGTLAPDAFFGALDGRMVRCDGQTWRVVVFSASEAVGHLWVQLALRGKCDYALSLRLNGDEGADEVLQLLGNWVASGAENPNIIRGATVLGDRIHEAAPRARRGAAGVGNNGTAEPRAVTRRSLPH